MEEIAEQRPNAAFSVDPAERERLAAEGNIVQPLKWHLNLPLCNKQILLHCGVVLLCQKAGYREWQNLYRHLVEVKAW